MKKVALLLSSMLYLCSFISGENLRFAVKPSLSPDAKTIYFSFNGDIFKVGADGGNALSVVATKGFDSNPRVSPDGKWLAFSSDLDGNNNVYIVALAGGEITQLTYNDASDIPVSWSSDSKTIFIESGRLNQVSTYTLNREGGTPVRLFENYFNTVSNLVQNPVNGNYIFNESMEGFSFATRKGYRGEHNSDLLEWNPNKKEYAELTTFDGKDLWPMVDVKGNIYYASEEANGFTNLVKYSKEKSEYLTKFDVSIQYPTIAYNGDAIVFIKDYQLNIYDLKTKKSYTPQIELVDSRVNNEISVKIETPLYASLSPDGKKLAFSFRGALFVSDAKGNFVTQIQTPKSERVTEVVWADNSTVYYIRTNLGWTNLYKQTIGQQSAEKEVFAPKENVKRLTLSSKRGMLAFVSGSSSLMSLNVSDDKVSELTKQEFWSFQNYSVSFSGDDKYLLFSATNLFDRDIFLYSFEAKKVINITNSATMEDDACFSADGKYIYFTANRTTPSFPRGARQNLFRASLYKSDTPFRAGEFNKLFSSEKVKKDSVMKFDFTDFQRRFEPIQRQGDQNSPFIYVSGDKTFLLYNSNHEGERGLYVQEIKDWDVKPAQRVKGVRSAGSYICNGKSLMVLDQSGLYTVDVQSASANKIEINYSFSKSIKDEFGQMLYEVWGLLEQNFYDVKFHGADWNKVKEKYASYLPYVKNRSELRMLVTDMLGELNSSHLGFSSSGREEDSPFRKITNNAGLLFENGNPYIIKGIIRNSKADNAENSVLPGDKLIKVDGVKVNDNVERDFYFTGPDRREEILLTFERAGKEFDVRLHTNTTAEIKDLLYLAWEDDCKALTEKLGKGKFAYIHMRDMGDAALENFFIEMNTCAVHKEGLILDLRYNNGGNVHQAVIDFLRQKQHFKWSYRDKEKVTHPNFTPANRPIIVLINERSLSDAEVTSNGIKELEIAKIVGTESYRWIIFTSGAGLVDGSFCRLPAWGCYSLDGKDLEKSGVKPDIYVKNTFKDRVESKDPQLERAIKELLSL
jgi:tricorn protease